MSDIEDWAKIERQFIQEELKWFRAGARLISPSGDDISGMKITELAARLEHAQKVLSNA